MFGECREGALGERIWRETGGDGKMRRENRSDVGKQERRLTYDRMMSVGPEDVGRVSRERVGISCSHSRGVSWSGSGCVWVLM